LIGDSLAPINSSIHIACSKLCLIFILSPPSSLF
jgi:hypothetical protein